MQCKKIKYGNFNKKKEGRKVKKRKYFEKS